MLKKVYRLLLCQRFKTVSILYVNLSGDDDLKKMVEAEIVKNSRITENVYEMLLENKYLAEFSEAGQFVGVYLDQPQMLLPRPFGICQTDKRHETVRIVYRIAGEGTRIMSGYTKGKTLKVLGPCGTGFTYLSEQRVIIAGGGMGAVPLLMLAEEIKDKNPAAEIDVFLGFQNAEQVVLQDEFVRLGSRVYISTDDGSVGFEGNVLSVMEAKPARGDILYACGPKVMLKAVSAYADANNIRAQVSLEERMACGIGACVCCAVKVKSENGTEYDKVCKRGPVFSSKEVVWDD